MLEKTLEKLESYHRNEPQIGGDGQMHSIDRVTRIPMAQSESLARLHMRIRPDVSLETGLAYGFSTLPVLDAMTQHGYGHHIAIDPLQMDYWHGVAYAAIRELGFEERFTLQQCRSEPALVEMIQAKRHIQFAFLDGAHSFDGLITDICLIDQIMDIGGVIVVNDQWLPAARSVASFVRHNLVHYRDVGAVHENIYVAAKTGHDARAWDHFAPFDGHGRKSPKPNIFRRLFARR